MKILQKGSTKRKYTYQARGVYWRFRFRDFHASLPGQPGDPDFEEKYERLMKLVVPPPRPPVIFGRNTFDFVIEKFLADAEFRALSKGSQYQYEIYARKVSKLLGDFDMTATTVEMIAAVRNSMTLGSGDNMRGFLSRLYSFGASRGYVEKGVNRARDMDRLKRKVEGHIPWSDDEIALLLKHATGAIRLMIIIGLCTGQRAETIETMEWSQVLGDNIRVRQKKTNALLDIPLHPLLKAELDALRAQGPVSGRIIRNSRGNPVGACSYRYRLSTLIGKIPNFPHRTPHGGRYATAAMLEDAGCKVWEIQAILGHSTYQQAMAYIIKRKNAGMAIAMLVTHAAQMPERARGASVHPLTAAIRPPLRLVSLAKAA